MCCFLTLFKTYPRGTEENEAHLGPSSPQTAFLPNVAFRFYHKLARCDAQGGDYR